MSERKIDEGFFMALIDPSRLEKPSFSTNDIVLKERAKLFANRRKESDDQNARIRIILEEKMKAGEKFFGVVSKGQTTDGEYTIVKFAPGKKATVTVEDNNGKRFEVSFFHPIFSEVIKDLEK